MSRLWAKVYLDKSVQDYNINEGADPSADRILFTDNFEVEFSDKDSLVEGLADYICEIFDVNRDAFIKRTDNEFDEMKFEYNQIEDDNGFYTELTEENPDGYLVDYTFFIKRIMMEVTHTDVLK
jgi:hypothetical protein